MHNIDIDIYTLIFKFSDPEHDLIFYFFKGKYLSIYAKFVTSLGKDYFTGTQHLGIQVPQIGPHFTFILVFHLLFFTNTDAIQDIVI